MVKAKHNGIELEKCPICKGSKLVVHGMNNREDWIKCRECHNDFCLIGNEIYYFSWLNGIDNAGWKPLRCYNEKIIFS